MAPVLPDLSAAIDTTDNQTLPGTVFHAKDKGQRSERLNGRKGENMFEAFIYKLVGMYCDVRMTPITAPRSQSNHYVEHLKMHDFQVQAPKVVNEELHTYDRAKRLPHTSDMLPDIMT